MDEIRRRSLMDRCLVESQTRSLSVRETADAPYQG